MARNQPEGTFSKKDRVTTTRDLPGVPEGTRGRVAMTAGFTWPRYWVRFENGVWMGSLDRQSLVLTKDWESFKKRRAEEAARPKEVAPVAAAQATEAAPSDAPTGEASKVPAHLLERSAQARARKAAAG